MSFAVRGHRATGLAQPAWRNRLGATGLNFSPRAVKDYARRHGLFAGPFIRLTFNTVLKKRAYTKDSITELVAQSQFGQGEVRVDPIGSNCGCINEY
jgi:hypothetical protein